MLKKQKSKSPFEDYEITVIIGDGGWEWSGGKGTTRAVVKLKSDITCAMPIMEKVIESCAYSREVQTAAFRYKNYGVVVHPHDMIIFSADNEAAAIEVINFLEDIVANVDNITKKVKTY